MDFRYTEEQLGFGKALQDLLANSDTPGVARKWADGDKAAGISLWERLAEQGVSALIVPEESGGMGATNTDLVVAFEVLGNQLVVGPWIEAAAYLPRALQGADLEALAEGGIATVAVNPITPFALDADVSSSVFAVSHNSISKVTAGTRHESVDITRHLFEVPGLAEPGTLLDAENTAALACAAQLLGAGERLLNDTVAYVSQRKQYGRIVGSYQALKHQLADVRIALDFARPLIQGASLTLDTDTGSRDVSAAKLAANQAAYLASRVGLQLHGAIGYTREFDLGLWINRVRALTTAWGDSDYHRARVATALLEAS
ncbi:MAG TPA: acyl-CoA dehydrogenase [Marmoricola sp.]|nr:acyl-CoA dehydrogenase [Marmoricola sp.]HNN47548.1 acyl-CoA dehydrogenase [Marmoricola sp.]